MSDKRQIDEATGVELKDHEWDGLRELNNPLPRWWLYILYATIAGSIVYMVLMPALPWFNGYTKGLLGQSDRATVIADVAEMRTARNEAGAGLLEAGLADIERDPSLLEFALAAGEAAFGDNCATCHGAGAQGFPGYPNLRDDAWLWGGSLEAIHETLLYGIRSGNMNARISMMPAYGRDMILDEAQINDVVEYVVQLSGREADSVAAGRGAVTFAEQCSICHGDNGMGDRTQGAPNLTDAIWLYGGDRETLYETVYFSRAGVMPGWEDRLDPVTVRALAVYVHTLGGGEDG